ncbi:hypothetical protein BSS2_II0660 [Brucella suis bv. 1 str. S2]|uniref:Uncharacterized protein n=8 Tax=Brucella TaxID=234 RepID=Q2YKV0_BRUA2|nr:hypothetical protein BRA0694 [Brucella suis 1330]AAX75954.1 hypothetical protein BruAb2_0536 [Brucella abortus bv. 1 str. 9-941]ABX63863.1 Hypothetical protein, conserved [Brucella canis ATCC 23365]ABY39656.1 Hypothetical protein, conserved [Brucella suis ATCC 23445]ACO02485.1 Hypothetical protein, conserved [Brucella melitensis ATCC 23457]ACU49809.1 hypothetical protein BMI_II688 [Brucella microti CCM 4915]AEK56171.1 hypothetical protein BPI_II748 [Brucella pinnipedialis B2/94]AEU07826.1
MACESASISGARGLENCFSYRRWGVSPRPENKPAHHCASTRKLCTDPEFVQRFEEGTQKIYPSGKTHSSTANIINEIRKINI